MNLVCACGMHYGHSPLMSRAGPRFEVSRAPTTVSSWSPRQLRVFQCGVHVGLMRWWASRVLLESPGVVLDLVGLGLLDVVFAVCDLCWHCRHSCLLTFWVSFFEVLSRFSESRESHEWSVFACLSLSQT